MKKKLLIITLIIILAFGLLAFRRAPITGHILGFPGDSWYMLCADGYWDIEINGDDSIRPVCVRNNRE